MRFTQCRATFVRSQALMAAVVALAACGRERATPVSPVSQNVADTTGVLRAVALVIVEMNARADSARVSPDFPANCRRPGLLCWNIETSGWHVSPGDLASSLANLLRVPVTGRSPASAPLPCPRATTAGGGYSTAVIVRFETPDSAKVVLTRRCDNLRDRWHRAFLSEEVFHARRVGGSWTATIYSVGVT